MITKLAAVKKEATKNATAMKYFLGLAKCDVTNVVLNHFVSTEQKALSDQK